MVNLAARHAMPCCTAGQPFHHVSVWEPVDSQSGHAVGSFRRTRDRVDSINSSRDARALVW